MNVVVLSIADWGAPLWTNKQYLAREFAAEYDVLYVESFGLRRPELSTRDARRLLARLRPPNHRSGHVRVQPPRLRVVSPRTIPFHSGPAAAANSLYMRWFWSKHLAEGSTPRVLWTFSPLTYGAEQYADAVVYHCVDLFEEQPGIDRGLVQGEERRLAEMGAIAIGSSPHVFEHLRSVGFEDVLLWPNVADVDPFIAASQPEARRERLVVFGGNLSPYKLDIALLELLVHQLPSDATLVMAGPWAEGGGGSIRRIRELSRLGVEFPGVLSIDELAHLFGRASVGIIPYLLNTYTEGVHPLKTAEYLAAGLPVVSTPLPSLDDDHGFVELGSGMHFVDTVLKHLDPPSDTAIERRQERSRSMSWGRRGATARTMVSELARDVGLRMSVAHAETDWPSSRAAVISHVAVVTFGSLADVEPLLASLARQHGRLAVAVVHNGPFHYTTDGLCEELKRLVGTLPSDGGALERLVLTDAGRNLGYSRGLNLGISNLDDKQHPADYVWLLNADLVLATEALSELVDVARRHPDVWCWGSTHLVEGSQSVRVAGFVEYSLVTGRRRPHTCPESGPDLVGCEVVTPRGRFIPGSAMFMPGQAFRALRGLSESYFLYFEELDLSERILSAGKKIGWARSSSLFHGGQRSMTWVPEASRFIAYHNSVSFFQFLRVHHPWFVPWGFVLRAVIAPLHHLVRGDRQAAGGTVKGALDALMARGHTGEPER